MEELIKKAKLAIGEDKPNDYKITHTGFPNELEESAPEISNVLRHSSFNEIANRYEQHDSQALSSQKKFKKFAHQATWSICFAAIAGSLLAGMAAAGFEGLFAKGIIFVLALTSTIGGCRAVYRLHQVKSQKLLERWMASRAKAETERLVYFSSLSRYLVKTNAGDIYLHLQFVCMFKRYQLEVQRLYYNARSRDHQNSLEKTSTIGAVAALCLALGSGMLGMIGAFIPDLLPLAALGTIGAAISIVASRREQLNQDERNAERYTRTADILSKIAEKHDDVLTVVAQGGMHNVIIKYVDAVNDQLSLEHRQWTSDVSEMSAALAALEESISDLHKN